MIITIAKASFLAALGLAGATCALVALKNALEQFVNGSPSSHARKKSILLMSISLAFLLFSIIIIFRSEILVKRFSKQIIAATTIS